MSKCCPSCKGRDFHLQTPAIFRFDGDDFVGDELLCDITENLNMADFDNSHLICDICEWEGKVKDLVEKVESKPMSEPAIETVEVARLKAKKHDELVARIRELENMLHGIENAIDHYDSNKNTSVAVYVRELEGIIELVESFCPCDSGNEDGTRWMIEPRCRVCGWCLDVWASTGPDILHCDNPDCGYVKRVSDGKEGTIEELLELVDSNGKDVKLKPAFWLVVQGYERQTQCSFEPTKPSGQKATCGVVLDCFRCSKERAAAAGVNRKISDPELDLYVMPWPVALPTGTFLAALLNAERIPED